MDAEYKNIRLDKLEMLKRTDNERRDLRTQIENCELQKKHLVKKTQTEIDDLKDHIAILRRNLKMCEDLNNNPDAIKKLQAENDELKATIENLQNALDECRLIVNDPRYQETVKLLENASLDQVNRVVELLENNPEQLEHLEELYHKDRAERQRRRGPLKEPIITDDTTNAPWSLPPFLYDNPEDNAIETKVSQHLLAAEATLLTMPHTKENLDEADKLTWKAFGEAQKLDYMPIQTRCCFWQARVRYAAKSYDAALYAFRKPPLIRLVA